MVLHSSLAGVDNHNPLGVSPYPLTLANGLATAYLIEDFAGEPILAINTVTAGRPGVQIGSADAGALMQFLVSNTGVSFAVQDEDFNNLFRINSQLNWSRVGPGRDVNEEFNFYIEGARATLVLPRVTGADVALIPSPEDGMLLYNTDDDELNLYADGAWVAVGGGGGGDHGALTGLGDDDHTQYMLLAGRGGGQVLIGGTGSGDDITFESTSHATKGTVFFRDAAIVINNNAVAATVELPNVTMMGGDGVAAPNDDIVSTVLTLDTQNEILYVTMLRNRNGAGDAGIMTTFGVGGTTTADRDAEFRLQGGDGTNRTRTRYFLDADTATLHINVEDDNAGAGTYASTPSSYVLGRSDGSADTTVRATSLTLWGSSSTGPTERSLQFICAENAAGRSLILCGNSSTSGLSIGNAAGTTIQMTFDPQNNNVTIAPGSNSFFFTGASTGKLTIDKAGAGAEGQLHLIGGASRDTAIEFEDPAISWFVGIDTSASENFGIGVGVRGADDKLVLGNNGSASAGGAGQLYGGGNGNGTDQAGGALTIRAGIGTGTGDPGNLDITVAPRGTTGTSLNTAERMMRFDAPDLGGGNYAPCVYFGLPVANNPLATRTLFEFSNSRSGFNYPLIRISNTGNSGIEYYCDALDIGDVELWQAGVRWDEGGFPDGGAFVIGYTVDGINTDEAGRLRVENTTGWVHVDSDASSLNDRSETMVHRYEHTTDNSTWTTIWAVTVPAGHQITIDAAIGAGEASGTGDTAGYTARGAAFNDGTSTTVTGTPSINAFEDDASWNVRFSSSGDDVLIQVLGDATNVVNWKAMVTWSMFDVTVTH